MSGRPLSPEYRLLIAAATPTAAADPRPLATHGVDWERLLALAAHHRIEALLHRHVKRTSAEVPQPILERLCGCRQRTAALELAARRQLLELSTILAQQGIPAVALKGSCLIETVYPEPGLRPMVDLDVLVGAAGVEQAARALSRAGYVPHTHYRAGPMRDLIWGPHHHHVPLSHPARPLPVELHKTITPKLRLATTGELIARATASRAGPYRLLDPSDLVVHIAAHFTIDRRYGGSHAALGQLADLAFTIDRQPVDWDALVDRAHQFELGGLVCIALRAVRELELAPIPASVLEDTMPASWTVAAGERLLAARVLPYRPPSVERRGVPTTVRHALAPGRAYMRARYNLPGASLRRLYLERARITSKILALTLRHPSQASAEITLNRRLDQAIACPHPPSTVHQASGTPETRPRRRY